MQWVLYGYDQKGRAIRLVAGDVKSDVMQAMCSSSFAADLTEKGFQAWELKNEWGGRHVSSGR